MRLLFWGVILALSFAALNGQTAPETAQSSDHLTPALRIDVDKFSPLTLDPAWYTRQKLSLGRRTLIDPIRTYPVEPCAAIDCGFKFSDRNLKLPGFQSPRFATPPPSHLPGTGTSLLPRSGHVLGGGGAPAPDADPVEAMYRMLNSSLLQEIQAVASGLFASDFIVQYLVEEAKQGLSESAKYKRRTRDLELLKMVKQQQAKK